MAKVVGLLRCSTDGQSDTSIPVQREAIETWCRKAGHEIVHWLDQSGQSGFCHRKDDIKKKLPELYRLCLLPHIEYDLLVYFDESRLGRMPPRLVGWLEEEASENGIKFINLQDPDRQDNIGTDVIKVVERATAYQESHIKRVKTVLGAKRACSQGWRVGGSAPLGYLRVMFLNGQMVRHSDGSPFVLSAGQRKQISTLTHHYTVGLIIDEETAPLVRQIFSLYCSGNGYKTIARWLNDNGHRTIKGKVWDARDVYMLVTNPVYAGISIYGKHKRKTGRGYHPQSDWTIKENAWDAIATEDQWAYVQARSREFEDKPVASKRLDRYMLNGGLMRCKECGAHFIGRKKGSGCRPKYICSGYKNNTTACSTYYNVDAEDLEQTLVDKIRVMLGSKETLHDLEALLSAQKDETQKVLRDLAGVKKSIQNVVNAIAQIGLDSDLEVKLSSLKVEKEGLELKLRQLRLNDEEPKRIIAEYRELFEGLKTSDRMTLRQIIRRVVEAPIFIDPKSGEIEVRVKMASPHPISRMGTQETTRYPIGTLGYPYHLLKMVLHFPQTHYHKTREFVSPN